jgi:hypothetical protein
MVQIYDNDLALNKIELRCLDLSFKTVTNHSTIITILLSSNDHCIEIFVFKLQNNHKISNFPL